MPCRVVRLQVGFALALPVSEFTPEVREALLDAVVAAASRSVDQVNATSPGVDQANATAPAGDQVSATSPDADQVNTTAPGIDQVNATNPVNATVNGTTSATQQLLRIDRSQVQIVRVLPGSVLVDLAVYPDPQHGAGPRPSYWPTPRGPDGLDASSQVGLRARP